MTKPEWGKKRTCTKCSTKFYDLGKKTILCPKCGTKFLIEDRQKKARSLVSTPKQAKSKKATKPKETPKEVADTDANLDTGDNLDKDLSSSKDLNEPKNKEPEDK